MSITPLISIGIPTYNRAQGLKKAIECIRSQTYINTEIIISDNCSTDPKVDDLLTKVVNQDSRIKIFRQKVNTGLAYNFQFVLSQANGKYFMWMSDDDLVKDNFIMELYKILEQFPDVNLAIPKLILYNDKHTIEETPEEFSSLSQESPTGRVYEYFRQPMKINYFYGLYRRKEAQQFQFIPEMFGADILFSMCIAYSGKAIVCPKTSYIYFMGGNSFDPEKLARVLRLPAWKAPLWGFNDSFHAVRYIIRHPISRTLSTMPKIIFGIRVYFMMLGKTRALLSFIVIIKRKILRKLLNRSVLNNG